MQSNFSALKSDQIYGQHQLNDRIGQEVKRKLTERGKPHTAPAVMQQQQQRGR